MFVIVTFLLHASFKNIKFKVWFKTNILTFVDYGGENFFLFFFET